VVYSFQLGSNGARYPEGDLISVDGTLYGTTTSYGGYKNGTLFSLNPMTDSETTLHEFKKSVVGNGNGVINVNGTLYGTIFYDGGSFNLCVFGCGIVYSYRP